MSDINYLKYNLTKDFINSVTYNMENVNKIFKYGELFYLLNTDYDPKEVLKELSKII